MAGRWRARPRPRQGRSVPFRSVLLRFTLAHLPHAARAGGAVEPGTGPPAMAEAGAGSAEGAEEERRAGEGGGGRLLAARGARPGVAVRLPACR